MTTSSNESIFRVTGPLCGEFTGRQWLFIGPLGTNFSKIRIEIQTFSFRKMHLKKSSVKWRPFCLGLNVLIPGILSRGLRVSDLQVSSGYLWLIAQGFVVSGISDRSSYVIVKVCSIVTAYDVISWFLPFSLQGPAFILYIVHLPLPTRNNFQRMRDQGALGI